jgi:xylulokinase
MPPPTAEASRSAGWRQLLADTTGAEVNVPIEEEAGCLGAAMQAIFAWSYNEGSPQTFEAIAERCVKVDKERTTRPEIPLAEEYEVDRSRYRSSLASLYAV